MERYRIHRTRRLQGTLIALTAASGLLLTGCGADSGDSGQSIKADSRQNSGGGSGYAPAPAQSNGSGEQQDGRLDGEQGDTKGEGEGEGDREGDREGDFAPSPDYLSTFALDVDTASYGYARRALAGGRVPDPSTIRPEEFVNSFRQDYERPDGNGFSVTVDGARTDRKRSCRFRYAGLRWTRRS